MRSQRVFYDLSSDHKIQTLTENNRSLHTILHHSPTPSLASQSLAARHLAAVGFRYSSPPRTRHTAARSPNSVTARFRPAVARFRPRFRRKGLRAAWLACCATSVVSKWSALHVLGDAGNRMHVHVHMYMRICRTNTHTHTYTHTHTHIYIYISPHIYTYICVHTCVSR